MVEIISALTASGHKSICVYDIRLNLLGRIESWVSLVWPERYNVYSDTQGAQLELHDTTALQALCRPDRYLWLVGSDRLMRIVSAQKSDHKLVIAAKDAACILDERGHTDTLSNFAAEETLRSLVSSAAAWPCLELGDAAGLTDTYSGEVKPGSLLKLVEQVCQELDIGFRVRFDQPKAKLLFELFRPKLDPNARYAPQYGNLTNLTYTESITGYKNVCVVVGAEGTATVGAAENTGSAPAGADRGCYQQKEGRRPVSGGLSCRPARTGRAGACQTYPAGKLPLHPHRQHHGGHGGGGQPARNGHSGRCPHYLCDPELPKR